MPLRSLRSRLVLIFLVSLTAAALGVAFIAVRQFDSYQREQSTKGLKQSAGAVAKFLTARQQSELGLLGKRKDFVPLLKELAGGRTRILLVHHQKLDFGTAPLPQGLEELPATYESQVDWSHLTRQRDRVLFNLNLDSKHYLAVAAPAFFHDKSLPKGGGLVAAIVLAKETSSLNTSTVTLLKQLVPLLALALVGILIVALLVRRRVARPVRELSQASEQIAEGLYDVQLRSKGRDELGMLATRFELMARKLKQADEHERNFLMRISHELRTPLTSIQGHVQAIADGVIDEPVEQAASLDVVLAEAARLQRLIGDLL